VAGDNIRVTSTITANSSVSINSLIMDGSSFNVGAGHTLGVASGAILIASGSGVQIGGNTGILDFGATEGMITINSTGNTFVRPRLTGTAGVSFFGSGTYIPANGSSNYSGDTLLQVRNVIPVVSSSGPAGSPTSGPFGTGRLILDGSAIRSTTGGDTTIANPVSIRSDTQILAVGGARRLIFTGPVTLEEGNRAIRNNSTADTLFSGVIDDGGSGFGLTVEGIGTGNLVLGAANTYTGPTRIVSSGLTLNSGSSIAAGSTVTLDGATAALSGEGTVFGPTSILTGSLLPGGSGGADAGLLTFGNDLGLGGELFMDINGLSRGATSGYDALDVTGMLTYGGTVTLNFGSTFMIGDEFDLFDFGSVGGAFSMFNLTGSYTGSLTNQLDGTWTGVAGGEALLFTESTGTLSFVPEPGRAVLGLIGLGFVLLRRRRFSS
jgi:hypothetical protein